MVRASITLSCALLLAMSLTAQQQDNNSAPPPQQNQSNTADQKKTDQQKSGQQKSDQQKKRSAAEDNPFPESQSEKAAQQDQSKDSSVPMSPQDEPAAPQPAANGKKPSAAEDNPFPESKSEKAAHQAEPAPSSAPNSGTQPDQDYSSSQTKLKGMDLSGASDARIADGAGGTIESPELGRKDTKVGEFYLHTGDYKGAYSRFVEATKVDPGNAQAVFDLAEAARHLNNRVEAVRNYQLYLSAVPDGPHSKDARKALKDLGVQPNS